MSADGVVWGMCEAYGCPLLGSYGVGGKWLCCCHFRAPVAAFDGITAEIHRHRGLVDAALLARRTGAGYKAIKHAEDQLVILTHEIGTQQSIPTAPVVGPTHGEHHFSETDA